MAFPQPTLGPVDPANFVGSGRVAKLAGSRDDHALKLYWVEFDPGARTNWHTHSGTQILLVQEGRCRFQREGEAPIELEPGETVTITGGVRHWHGATPEGPMAHIAVNIDTDTVWHEPVTQEQYQDADAHR